MLWKARFEYGERQHLSLHFRGPPIQHHPINPPGWPFARSTLYELHGIIDVLTNVQLGAAPTTNVIREAIQTACPTLTGNYEVIVDYKGSKRPATNHAYWQQHYWQVRTYSWLRTRQPNALPVAAAVLLYVNELAPVREDLDKLKHAMASGYADVIPVVGSPDDYQLSTWRPGNATPTFSLPFRLARAIRGDPRRPNQSKRGG